MRKSYLKSTRFVLFVAVGILLAVSASLFIAGCKGKEEPKASGESSLEMSKEALKGRLGDPELIVIDVRMAKAWEDCDSKITGARREDPAKLSTWAEHYAKDKTIVLLLFLRQRRNQQARGEAVARRGVRGRLRTHRRLEGLDRGRLPHGKEILRRLLKKSHLRRSASSLVIQRTGSTPHCEMDPRLRGGKFRLPCISPAYCTKPSTALATSFVQYAGSSGTF